jgi:NADH-quinone oxidoreductase subunit M
MGFVLLGAFTFREIALQGVVMQLLTHGVSTGALFVLAGMLKERLHTRNINQMGGLWTSMPHMGALAMVFVMASLGLPLLGNFIAEFLILMGAFAVSPVLTVIASSGLVLSALYSLRIVQKVFMGQRVVADAHSNQEPVDLSAREWIIMACLTAAIIFLGLYPQPVFDMTQSVIGKLVRL